MDEPSGQRPTSAIETRVATTTADIDARTQREVANLKEIIWGRYEQLQQEIDGRFEGARRELQLLVESSLAGKKSDRELSAQRIEVVQARLDGMDRANVVLQETVTRVPTDVQLQVGNLRDVMDEKFNSIDKQFAERDIRSEREARDNKVAVDAAFAAQKDSATQTDAANAKAIEKSETATAKTIDTLGAAIESSVKALRDQIDDLKARVQAIESTRLGGRESVGDRQAGNNALTQIVGVVFAAVILGLALYAAFHK